jgi:Fur family ferric uptake transcriptional regulator
MADVINSETIKPESMEKSLERLESQCLKRGIRITGQRRLILQVLAGSSDHPNVETVYQRATGIDATISIATVYRTVRVLEEEGVLDRHDFRDGRSRYEVAPDSHHDHLIDVKTGEVLEFVDAELEDMQKRIAERLGYRLVDHRLELYGQQITKA